MRHINRKETRGGV